MLTDSKPRNLKPQDTGTCMTRQSHSRASAVPVSLKSSTTMPAVRTGRSTR